MECGDCLWLCSGRALNGRLRLSNIPTLRKPRRACPERSRRGGEPRVWDGCARWARNIFAEHPDCQSSLGTDVPGYRMSLLRSFIRQSGVWVMFPSLRKGSERPGHPDTTLSKQQISRSARNDKAYGVRISSSMDIDPTSRKSSETWGIPRQSSHPSKTAKVGAAWHSLLAL